MNDFVKRGPGRPRKTTEEVMIDTPNEVLKDIAIKIVEGPKAEPAPAEQKVKLYTFKVLRHTNFANPDFEVIDVDEVGNWLPPRAPVSGEYGPHTKVWAGTIVNVNGERAKSFDKHSIGKRVENYD